MFLADKGLTRGFFSSLTFPDYRVHWKSRSPFPRSRPRPLTHGSRWKGESSPGVVCGFEEEYPAPKTEQLSISLDGEDREVSLLFVSF